jgi:hypothetical protein
MHRGLATSGAPGRHGRRVAPSRKQRGIGRTLGGVHGTFIATRWPSGHAMIFGAPGATCDVVLFATRTDK